MTLARVLKSKKPVPSNNFINEPVVESRPSANNTNRPLACKSSAMRFTAYAELVSTGEVRLSIIIQASSEKQPVDPRNVIRKQEHGAGRFQRLLVVGMEAEQQSQDEA